MQINPTLQQGKTAAGPIGGRASDSAAGGFDAVLGAAVEAIDGSGSADAHAATAADLRRPLADAGSDTDANTDTAAITGTQADGDRDETSAAEAAQIGHTVDAVLSLLQPAGMPLAAAAVAAAASLPTATDGGPATDGAPGATALAASLRPATDSRKPGNTGGERALAAAADRAAEVATNIATDTDAMDGTDKAGMAGEFSVSAAADGSSTHGLPAQVAALAQISPASQTAAATAATAANNGASAHVPVAVGSSGWPQAFGEQVLWSARQSMQSASLTLNPPELGPVQIELTLTHDRADAHFSSPQPEVRQAIEQALPQLKELFANAGLQLQQASVDSGQRRQQERQEAAQAQAAASSRGNATAASQDGGEAAVPRARPLAGHRLLDLYA